MLLENTAEVAPAAAAEIASKPRQKAALTDSAVQALKPRAKAYKVTDGEGMYVVITSTGVKSFRYDYRLNGNRETLTVGRYEPGTPSRSATELDSLEYGSVV